MKLITIFLINKLVGGVVFLLLFYFFFKNGDWELQGGESKPPPTR